MARGSHHSSDNLENLAISAGSTVEPPPPELRAPKFCCMAMAVLSRGDVVAEIQRRSDGRDGLRAFADATNRHVAIVEDAAQNALVDVDALDLVERHFEGAPLDEPGLVHDAQIGDVGLGGPAVEQGFCAPVQ